MRGTSEPAFAADNVDVFKVGIGFCKIDDSLNKTDYAHYACAETESKERNEEHYYALFGVTEVEFVNSE